MDFPGIDIDIDASEAGIRAGSWHQLDFAGDRDNEAGPAVDQQITHRQTPTAWASFQFRTMR